MEFRFDSVDVSIRGVNKQFKVFNHPGGAAVIAVKGDRILLIEEYRPAVGRKILEVPADLLEPEEDPLSRAQRELRKKLGTKLNRGIRLAQASFSRIQLKLFTFMWPEICGQVSKGEELDFHWYTVQGIKAKNC